MSCSQCQCNRCYGTLTDSVLPSDKDDPVADRESEYGPLDGRRAGGGDGDQGGCGQRHVQHHDDPVHRHARWDPRVVRAVAHLQEAQADRDQGDGQQRYPTEQRSESGKIVTTE